MAVTGQERVSRRLSTKVLMFSCREPGSADFPLAEVDYVQASALDTVRAVFPHIDEAIAGKRVIDFGCGRGYQSVGYALAGAESVVGVEIQADLARLSAARVAEHGLADRVQIVRELADEIKGESDSIQSEHYVRVYISFLRKKLQDDPTSTTHPLYIFNEPGIGYRFSDLEPVASNSAPA